MSNEWNAEAPGMQASLPHDLEEAHVEILAARARIAELESRERARSTECQDTLRATLRLRESIREAVAPVLYPDDVHVKVSAPTESRARQETPTTFEFDAARDRAMAHEDERFDHVVHVFHQDWHGIRAACGTLPGHKLAIPSSRTLTAGEIHDIVAALMARGINRVAMHGMSYAMDSLARALRRATPARGYLVWHGAPAMWMYEAERKFFQMAKRLKDEGIAHGFHVIRGGTDVFVQGAYDKQLLNPPPRSGIRRAAPWRSKGAVVLSPSWNLLHKNLCTNLAGAGVSPSVAEIWVMASDAPPSLANGKRWHKVPHQSPLEMLRMMASVDLILNVTLIDCHPMVDMEALSVGTPCLRGPLFLDALEDHPYVRATEVRNPLSIADVSAGIERVLSIPASELSESMADYGRQMAAVSLARYVEFLEL